MKTIELGMVIKDKITGFQGVAIYRSEYLNGCPRIGIQPQEMKDGKPVEDHMFDEPQLEIVGEKKVIDIIPVKQKIEIGKEIKDSVSDLKGICIGRTVFVNGCARILLGSKVDKDKKFVKNIWIDEGQVEYVQKSVWSKDKSVDGGRRDTGGPAEKPHRNY